MFRRPVGHDPAVRLARFQRHHRGAPGAHRISPVVHLEAFPAHHRSLFGVHRLHPVVYAHHVQIAIQHADPVLDGIENTLQKMLARLEGRGSALPFGDVVQDHQATAGPAALVLQRRDLQVEAAARLPLAQGDLLLALCHLLAAFRQLGYGCQHLVGRLSHRLGCANTCNLLGCRVQVNHAIPDVQHDHAVAHAVYYGVTGHRHNVQQLVAKEAPGQNQAG